LRIYHIFYTFLSLKSAFFATKKIFFEKTKITRKKRVIRSKKLSGATPRSFMLLGEIGLLELHLSAVISEEGEQENHNASANVVEDRQPKFKIAILHRDVENIS
jgi:hypothetical protein